MEKNGLNLPQAESTQDDLVARIRRRTEEERPVTDAKIASEYTPFPTDKTDRKDDDIQQPAPMGN